MHRILLIGSKDFARQIRVQAEKTGKFQIVGYLDDFEKPGTIIDGLPVLGCVDDAILLYEGNKFDYLFSAIGYNSLINREKIFEKFKGNIPFANIIMPSADIDSSVNLGEGIFIGARSSVGINTTIYDNVYVGVGTVIGHDCSIGSHTYFSGRDFIAGFVSVGKRNFFGLSSCVADHISIADDVWIGIGSIVGKDIKESGKYMCPYSSKLVRYE